MHAGHIKALELAKENCDELTALIIRDMSHKSHKLYQENIEDRFMKLEALRSVDRVMVCENNESFMGMLALLNYDRYFLDETYRDGGFEEGKKIVGEDRLFYVPRKHGWSTTEQVLRIRDVQQEN